MSMDGAEVAVNCLDGAEVAVNWLGRAMSWLGAAALRDQHQRFITSHKVHRAGELL